MELLTSDEDDELGLELLVAGFLAWLALELLCEAPDGFDGSVLDGFVGIIGGKALVIMLLLFEVDDEEDGAAASFDSI